MSQVVGTVRLPKQGPDAVERVAQTRSTGRARHASTRIVVVDPHPYAAEGLGALLHALTDDMEVVDTSADPSLAPEQVRRHGADLLIVEPRLRGVLSMLRAVRETSETTKVVVLTGEENRHQAAQLVRAGVHAYISKHIASVDLVRVLQIVRSGRVVISASVTKELFADPAAHPAVLTVQDRALLKLIVDGLDNGEIARRMMVSESTLKRNIHRLLKTLDARNKIEAAVHAASKGLLEEA